MSDQQEIKRPSFVWGLTEGWRAAIELGLYLPYRYLKKEEYTGDGHPVMILPGFMASDMSTIPLRSFIDKLGYKVYGWGEGRNYASVEYLELLNEKLYRISERHDSEVTLVGWSLGGVYAREMAKAQPDLVRQIITMGSPFKGVTLPNNAKWMYDLLTRGNNNAQVDPDLLEGLPYPADVPTTAIYSKEDGVVPWRLCMEEESKIHQNIQVRGSHLGLGVNPTVLDIIADRLPLEKEHWVKFETSNLLEKYLLYPSMSGEAC